MNIRLPDLSTLLQHNAIYQRPHQHRAGMRSIQNRHQGLVHPRTFC